MIKRVYIDTSVVGGCFDKEFELWSNWLFDEFKAGVKICVYSDILIDELEEAPDFVFQKFNDLPLSIKEGLIKDQEVEDLANRYIDLGAITPRYYEDALHIAIATVNRVDILASWNFKHIVNLNRIEKYNAVNLWSGYPRIEIRTPRDIINLPTS